MSTHSSAHSEEPELSFYCSDRRRNCGRGGKDRGESTELPFRRRRQPQLRRYSRRFRMGGLFSPAAPRPRSSSSSTPYPTPPPRGNTTHTTTQSTHPISSVRRVATPATPTSAFTLSPPTRAPQTPLATWPRLPSTSASHEPAAFPATSPNSPTPTREPNESVPRSATASTSCPSPWTS